MPPSVALEGSVSRKPSSVYVLQPSLQVATRVSQSEACSSQYAASAETGRAGVGSSAAVFTQASFDVEPAGAVGLCFGQSMHIHAAVHVFGIYEFFL